MWPKFKHIQAFIVILVTCKNEEDPLKIGARVVTTFLPLDMYFSRRSRATNSVVPSRF